MSDQNQNKSAAIKANQEEKKKKTDILGAGHFWKGHSFRALAYR